MTSRLEPLGTEDFRRQGYQGKLRFLIFLNPRPAFGKAVQRSRDLVPGIAPQRLVIIRVSQNPFDVRQNQLVSSRQVVDCFPGELSRQWRARIFINS